MTYDIFTYNGEADILEIHLNVLDGSVDKFIIVEFDKTFSGKDKPSYYMRDEERFKKWAKKIDYYHFYEIQYNKYLELAKSSPNTKGAEHWTREFCQKEMIKDALKGLKDNDICFIGDVDEIWNPNIGYNIKPSKLSLKVYAYYLNNRSSEIFRGTFVAHYKDIKDECLNHLRSNTETTQIGGWHFTSMHNQLERKLTDSYTSESYATDGVLGNLKENIENNRDFLGRSFSYQVDESDWPDYLKINRDKYLHLLK